MEFGSRVRYGTGQYYAKFGLEAFAAAGPVGPYSLAHLVAIHPGDGKQAFGQRYIADVNEGAPHVEAFRIQSAK